MRYAPILSFLACIALFGALLLVRPAQQEGTVVAALPTLALKPHASKMSWDQQKLQGRVTLLNFFASWCMPCAAEMPELMALKKQFPSLHIEGVAWNDQPLALDGFLRKNGNPFRAVWIDPKGDATIALGIRGIPESILVDAKGQVRYRLHGPLTPQARPALDALIQQLLVEAKDGK